MFGKRKEECRECRPILDTHFEVSDSPDPPIEYCIGGVVCAVEEIKKSALFGGEGGKMCPKCLKINFYCPTSKHFCPPLKLLVIFSSFL